MTAELLAMPDLMPALPEILLVLGALALLMVGAFGGEKSTPLVTGICVALLTVAGLILLVSPHYGTTFNGAFVQDAFSQYMKVLVLIGSGFAIAMSVAYARSQNFDRFEYPILIVLATVGMMLMLSANDLISMYLGVELQSLALYVVASINRDSVRSTEAGLKYFVLGALSSGMLLYGMSFIYGFTGHTDFVGIASALTDEQASRGLVFGIAGPLIDERASLGVVFGIVFMLAGIAFKISAVPFHMWTPDVYEGAPTPVTAFFAAAPKIAAFGMLVRVLIEALGDVTTDWQQIVVFISIASMGLGAFAAIGQKNIKRLMAYSSIGNMGYALVGLAAGTQAGVHGLIVFMTAYLAMTLGAFACILSMRRKEGMVEEISDLAGLSKTNLPMAMLLAVIMFSLTGLPPLIGFFGKFYVFIAAMEAGLVPLVVIGLVASVVAAYYYLRVIKVMFFDEPTGEFLPMSGEMKIVLGLSSAVVGLFFIMPEPIMNAAANAASVLF
ncbi:NADH-quinone oxidoreductase subunit N [Pseudovibrio axinellae]|uniref:NADH-quinone oxidoreductase subunit N n=1 Tax=Pseudovibrio axinellae TaxID=989403 RepID=A0A166B3M6_9HYPH|nr:NADH-quinone oxidoreductase subunit N [Pseudovibrio axinellae]KZL21863.1 NADH-quinone oxidoreductase subunit N [Pseudovibrio axinellae]SEQ81361.1 NADH dehydrogenase subunit N [Pseudovibrio axinellae]